MQRTRFQGFDQWEATSGFSLTPAFDAMSSVEATKLLAENLLAKEGFTAEEKLCFVVLKESNTSLLEWENLNEGLLDKLKEVGKKALDKGGKFITDVKNQIGQEIKGIPDFFKTLADGVKRVVGYIKEYVMKAIKFMFGTPEKFVDETGKGAKAEMEKELTDAAKEDASKLKVEAQGVVDLTKGIPKLISPRKISDDMQKAIEAGDAEKVKEKELEVIEEGLKSSMILAFAEAVKNHTKEEIFEGFKAICEADDHGSHNHMSIPFISTITHLIDKIPPFSWLSKLAEFIGKNANKGLTAISETFAKRGAVEKATEFVILGTIVGLYLENLIKGGIKHALAVFFPPIHGVLVILGTIASAVWCVHFISTLAEGAGLADIQKELDHETAAIGSHE